MPPSESQDDVHLDYLDTLDAYQAHMQQLCTGLSHAFIALAAANVSCPPAGDRRYGAEQYAHRQAIAPTRGLRIICPNHGDDGGSVWEGIALSLPPSPAPPSPAPPSPATDAAASSGLRRRRRKSGSGATQSPPRGDDAVVTQSPPCSVGGGMTQSPPSPDNDCDTNTKTTPLTPLQLFHPLPPSSLRAAADAFSASLASVPVLATTLHRLHVLATAMSAPQARPPPPPPPSPSPQGARGPQPTQSTAPEEGPSPTAALQPAPTNPALAQETAEHVYKLLAQAPSFPLPSSPLDTRSGYIHLCTPPQAVSVARRFFPDDYATLWVLRVPLGRLAAGAVRWEAAGDDGERFPHLYGNLEPDAVDAIGRVTRCQNGLWDWGAVAWDSS